MSCSSQTAADINVSNPSTPQAFLSWYGYPDTGEIEGLILKYGNGQRSFSSSGSSFLETVIRRNMFAGPDAPSNYNPHVAHVIARGFLYTTGCDCPSCKCTGAVAPNVGTASTIKLAASATTLGIQGISVVSSVGGASSLGFAAAGTALSATLGLATLGIGLAIGPLLALIQHHAQAVATEDNTVCAVSNALNQTLPAIDQAVASGSITAAQGVSAVQSLMIQLKAALAPISGAGSSGHPCNAGCEIQALLNMHLDFANTFYGDISPMTQPTAAPGSASIQTASAGTAAALADSIAPPSGSAQIVNTPALPGTASGTFATVPVVPANGTGSVSIAGITMNPIMLLIFGGLALWALIALMHK